MIVLTYCVFQVPKSTFNAKEDLLLVPNIQGKLYNYLLFPFSEFHAIPMEWSLQRHMHLLKETLSFLLIMPKKHGVIFLYPNKNS